MPIASPDTSATLADTPLPGHAPEGLTAQFGAVYRDLVRFFTRRTGNEDDARDLAQDTWLRLAEHERSQGHVAPIHTRAYLFTVAQHVVQQHGLRQAATPPSVELTEMLNSAKAVPDVDPVLDLDAQ